MIEFEPTTRVLTRLVEGVRDEQLTAPTPCAGTSLGAMLGHLDGLSMAFTLAARKQVPEGGSQPPSADAAQLAPDWRTRFPGQLATLAEAWRDEAAWAGMTKAGGLDLPGHVAAMVALDEVLVHGWDIAAASGQRVKYDDASVQVALGFVEPSVAENPNGTPGLFGPPVPVPEGAPLLDRLIGLTGRDPRWSAATVAPDVR